MRFLFMILLVVMGRTLYAQHEKEAVWQTSFAAGLLAGGSANALNVQAITGLGYRSFFVGAGVAYDGYYFKSIPVFLSFEKRLTSKAQTPFAFIRGGLNLPKDKNNVVDGYGGNLRNGWYGETGVGYIIPLKRRTAFMFSAGFSVKTMSTQTEYVQPMPFPFEDVVYRTMNDYVFRRLVVSAGFRF